MQHESLLLPSAAGEGSAGLPPLPVHLHAVRHARQHQRRHPRHDQERQRPLQPQNLVRNVNIPSEIFWTSYNGSQLTFFQESRYPVLHPFVDEDESKKFRSSGNCRKPALAVGSLAGRLECVASPESKHTKNLPQTDEKRGMYFVMRGLTHSMCRKP